LREEGTSGTENSKAAAIPTGGHAEEELAAKAAVEAIGAVGAVTSNQLLHANNRSLCVYAFLFFGHTFFMGLLPLR
jgi:hypothetical protein